MVGVKFFVSAAVLLTAASADPSAVELVQDIYKGCLRDFSVGCVQPKAMQWMADVSNDNEIRITDDLSIVKKDTVAEMERERGFANDIFESFEDFLQTHELVAKAPAILSQAGPLAGLVPRGFKAEDLRVPLAATGRSSKIVKKVIVPFLLGLKFKTAVLVPLALTLIALKTWKALTLGLLSLVLTGALVIFKFTKPKVVNYEVIHYPQHVEHHVEHPPESGWEHPGYGRQLSGNDLAYNAYAKE